MLATALALGASAAQADNGLFHLGAGISHHDKLSGFTNSGVSFPDIDNNSSLDPVGDELIENLCGRTAVAIVQHGRAWKSTRESRRTPQSSSRPDCL
jgi:hypothetical protein